MVFRKLKDGVTVDAYPSIRFVRAKPCEFLKILLKMKIIRQWRGLMEYLKRNDKYINMRIEEEINVFHIYVSKAITVATYK